MQIQTYEIEEINSSEASTLAADGEALLLIDKLGLKGQQKLLSSDGNATRFPYPALTKLEALVYSTCFPSKTNLVEFEHEIIPVRVLQVALHAQAFEQCKYMEIWHSPISKEDPILVGRAEQYSGITYILARWGAALLPFEELLKIAQIKYESVARIKLAKLARDLRVKEENISNEIAEAFLDGNVPTFSLYA